MKPSSSSLRFRFLERALWCAGAAAVLTVLDLASAFRPIENLTYDLRVRWAAPARPGTEDIVILAIDGPSLQRMEPRLGRWPWPHGVMAGLIDYCSEASVIGLDIIYTQRDPAWPGERDLLAETARAQGSVCVAALFDHQLRRPAWPAQLAGREWQPLGEETLDLPRFRSVEAPYPELAAAAAGIGHVNCEPDADGVLRRYVAMLRCQGWTAPSLALEMARLHLKLSPADVQVTARRLRLGARRIPLDGAGGMRVRYTAREAYTPAAFPIADVLDAYREELSGRTPGIPRVAFRGKAVLIGSTTSGLYADLEVTPISRTAPGVVVHADALNTLLTGAVYRTLPRALELALLVALVFLPGLLPSVRPLTVVAGWAGAAAGYALFAGAALWTGRWMIPVAAPLAGLTVAGGLVGLRSWYGELIHRRRLERLDQAKQRFTDMLVHDLKGHTAGIQMALAMLERRLPPGDRRARDLFHTAESGGRRLADQIYALLDIRRMQEGQLQLAPAAVPAESLLESCCAEFSAAAELSGVRLARKGPAVRAAPLWVDEEILARVLRNLLWNAVQYATPGSDLELGVEAGRRGEVELYVANHGRIIPPERREEIFEVFVSGAVEDKQVKLPSSGLGLAFCKLAVEAHGGSIRIESPWNEDGGVKVRLVLPVACREAGPRRKSPSPPGTDPNLT